MDSKQFGDNVEGKKKMAIKLVVAGVIFSSVYASYVSKNILVVSVGAAAAAAISYFAEPFFDYLEDSKKRNDRQMLIRSYSDQIASFLNKNFTISAPIEEIYAAIKDDDFDLTKDELYWRFISKINTPMDRYILYILALSNEIDNEQDLSVQSLHRSNITAALQNFDIMAMDEKTINLMKEYGRIRNINSTDYKDMFKEFSRKYSTIQIYVAQIFIDNKQAEEFRKTLSNLLSTGKLNLPLVNKKLKKKLDEILREHQIPGGFIVIMNRYQRLDSVAKSLDKFPQIKIGKIYPQNFPAETKFLHMRIIYPKNQYSSPAEFMEKEILNKVPENEKSNGFVAVLPLEITGISTYPKSEKDIEKDIMRTAFQAINYLTTGLNKSIDEILMEYTLSNVSMSELLSVIPFNIFVPDLKGNAKEFIIENYNDIQKKFAIKTLFDWANVNPDDLSATLVALDTGGVLPKSEWSTISQQICTEAKKHVAAIA